MEWVGHRDSRIVARYRHLRDDDGQQAMQELDFVGMKRARRVRTLQFDAVVFRKRRLPRAACKGPIGEKDGISGIVCPIDCPTRWDKQNRGSQVICKSQLASLGSLEAERSGFEPEMPVSRHTGLAIRRFRPLSHLSGAQSDCQASRRPLRTVALRQATQSLTKPCAT